MIGALIGGGFAAAIAAGAWWAHSKRAADPSSAPSLASTRPLAIPLAGPGPRIKPLIPRNYR